MREKYEDCNCTRLFKESLTADQVAEAIKKRLPTIDSRCRMSPLPVGDGGEGTVDSIRHSLDIEEKWIQVTGPFGQKEAMSYFQKEQTGTI